LEKHPEVKKVRLDMPAHQVNVRFYETPSDELLTRINTAVRRSWWENWIFLSNRRELRRFFHLHKIVDEAQVYRGPGDGVDRQLFRPVVHGAK
jgi:hypothetical protein